MAETRQTQEQMNEEVRAELARLRPGLSKRRLQALAVRQRNGLTIYRLYVNLTEDTDREKGSSFLP